MNETLNEIRNRMGEENLTNSCGSSNCRTDTDNVPRERVVVNVDLAFKAHGETGKHCDRILFYISPTENYLVVALIELKSGTFKASDVGDQLRNSAKFVHNFVPQNCEIICVPILFHGPGNHKSQFNKLRREKINFSGKPIPISKNKCGAPKNLASVLMQASELS